ncbi:unnamed protein product [Brassica rapa subsp. trilocularis]
MWPVHRLVVNHLLPRSESDCKFCSVRRKVALISGNAFMDSRGFGVRFL